MADFCMQCSIEIFNEDFEDLANIVKPNQVLRTICEGCGDCTVTYTGKCISIECLKKHGESK